MQMLKKSMFCIILLFIVVGCANQQKEETTNPSVEELSLTVKGMA